MKIVLFERWHGSTRLCKMAKPSAYVLILGACSKSKTLVLYDVVLLGFNLFYAKLLKTNYEESILELNL